MQIPCNGYVSMFEIRYGKNGFVWEKANIFRNHTSVDMSFRHWFPLGK
jgi:hypothetical protein